MRTLLAAQRKPLVIPSLAYNMRKNGKLLDPRKLGMFPEVAGGDGSGYNQAGDIITQTQDGRPLNEIWADFQAALQMYNDERDRLMAVLSFRVTKVIEDVYQGGGTVDFERASEFGEPRGIRPVTPTFFSMGYSFDWFDVAIRYTWMYLADATQGQIDALNNEALEADNRLLFTETMTAIFENVTRSATIAGQNYNVFPIYNGDSTVPPRYKGTTFTAPHTHFLVSGAATVDSGDLTGVASMEDHLKHHGYSWQNGSALILLVNQEQLATIKTFRVADGDDYDFIQSQSLPAWALTPADLNPFTGQQSQAAPPTTWNGLDIAGRYGPWFVIEQDNIPAKYMLGFASGGSEAAANLVGIREHANPSLRGLRLVKGPDADYPLIDSFYQRGFGTGIRQRGAGVVMQVKASGNYAVPAAYASDN